MFSSTPAAGAEWVAAATARETAARRFYVRVDTSALAPKVGLVEMYVMRRLFGSTPWINIGHTAIAGRSTIHVMPL